VPPNPKFDRNGTYIEYYPYLEPVRYYAGQTISVDAGTTLYAHVRIVNNGDAGKIGVQLWDWKSNKGLLWKEYNVSAGQTLDTDLGSFKASSDMDLVFYVYYWDGSRWVQTDSLG